MSRIEPWLPVLAIALFVIGSLLEVIREPTAPASWCWLVGSLLFMADAARRAGRD